MIVSDEAPKDDDGHPYQECEYREPFGRCATADRLFPILIVFPKRYLEDGCNKRTDGHKEHLYPKRNRYQFSDGLTDHHQTSGREEDAKPARQPGAKTVCRLPQCLIHPRPPQNAEIHHEHGRNDDTNPNDVNGLNRGDDPAVMVLDNDAQIRLRQPFGESSQNSLPVIDSSQLERVAAQKRIAGNGVAVLAGRGWCWFAGRGIGRTLGDGANP